MKSMPYCHTELTLHVEILISSCPQNWEEDEDDDDEDMDTMEERQNHADEEMREDSKANGEESDLDPENESEEE